MRTFISFKVFLFAVLTLANAHVAADAIGIIYPTTDRHYRPIFDAIIAGAKDELSSVDVVYTRPLAPVPDVEALGAWLKQIDAQVVITLGRRASDAYAKTGFSAQQIVGALDTSPQQRSTSGISLAVDPALLFETLRQVAPQVTRVLAVYDPDKDTWLAQHAERAAKAHSLELKLHTARDLREGATAFLHLIQSADPATDALWLPLNSSLVTVDDTMPFIVEESWRKRMVVFSHNLAHVDLGVLFALVPDNEAMGRRLAQIAKRALALGSASVTLEPLRDVKRAFNLRIASHLGLKPTTNTLRTFDIIYPTR